MKAIHFNKKDFTVNDFLEQVKDCNEDAIIVNACMYPNYVEELLDKGEYYFETIRGFYNEGYEVIIDYSFSSEINEGKTLKEFIQFLETEKVNKEVCLNRDVEDGFVYSNYDDIVFNKEFIVLC